MRTLTNKIAKYAAAANYHTPAYVERLSHGEQVRIRHLLLPRLHHQFRDRFVLMRSIAPPSNVGAKPEPTCSASAELRSWR